MHLKISRSACACLGFFITLLVVSLAAAPAHAGTIGPNNLPTISISADGHGPNWQHKPSISAYRARGNGRGLELDTPVYADAILGNMADVVIEELAFDPDPFVVNNILITNTTAMTQIYTVGVTLPTTYPAPNVISGSVLTGVIDSSGNGTATVASVGVPIYQAQIDGTTVATLQDPPFSVSVPPGVLDSDSASFGPTVNFVPVTSDIGILLRFSLSAGDTATVISRFDVVPEPATFGLAAMALASIVVSRRRFD